MEAAILCPWYLPDGELLLVAVFPWMPISPCAFFRSHSSQSMAGHLSSGFSHSSPSNKGLNLSGATATHGHEHSIHSPRPPAYEYRATHNLRHTAHHLQHIEHAFIVTVRPVVTLHKA